MANKFSLKDSKANSFSLFQLGVLLVIGYACSIAPIVVTIMWGCAVVFALYGYLKKRVGWIWYTIIASPILEVLARMSKADYIPDEVGKYFLVFAIGLLVLYNLQHYTAKAAHRVGWLLLAVIVPSLIVALSSFDYEQWVFNIFSLLELAILLILISRERWDIERFCKTIQVSVACIIPFLVYLTINTPDFSDIDFELGANSDTSAGFGSNQVSTILGLGMLLIVVLLTLKRPFVKSKPINYILIAYLLFRGLLTFSRGGVVVAVLAIAIVMLPAMLSNPRAFVRYTFMFLGLGVIGALVFVQVNDITGNQLLLRYEGETQGTQAGVKDKTLDKVTSGRSKIIVADARIFADYLLFGVGPGGAKSLRGQYFDGDWHKGGVAAHTEYSRLLAEHGLGGLLACLILTIFPIMWVYKQRVRTWKGIAGAFMFLAIFTSMHAAMRTNTTVVCFVVGTAPLVLVKQKKKVLVKKVESEQTV